MQLFQLQIQPSCWWNGHWPLDDLPFVLLLYVPSLSPSSHAAYPHTQASAINYQSHRDISIFLDSNWYPWKHFYVLTRMHGGISYSCVMTGMQGDHTGIHGDSAPHSSVLPDIHRNIVYSCVLTGIQTSHILMF